MKCEICGEEYDALNTCSVCNTHFCNNCGDPQRLLCKDCLEFDEALDGDISDLA